VQASRSSPARAVASHGRWSSCRDFPCGHLSRLRRGRSRCHRGSPRRGGPSCGQDPPSLGHRHCCQGRLGDAPSIVGPAHADQSHRSSLLCCGRGRRECRLRCSGRGRRLRRCAGCTRRGLCHRLPGLLRDPASIQSLEAARHEIKRYLLDLPGPCRSCWVHRVEGSCPVATAGRNRAMARNDAVALTETT
jgi:hypothetical protein